MINNKHKNRAEFCASQAESFWDYAAKMPIHDKDEMLSIFNHWANSKDFIEEDLKHIHRLVDESWEKEMR